MTQLQTRREDFGGTDQRWIGSREGFDTAVTKTLDYDSWESKVVNGRLKGGEAISYNTSTNKWVPYASGGSNGTGTLWGFLRNDVPVVADAGDIVAPMIDRGRIIVKYLPSTVAANATLHASARFNLVDVTL